MYIEAAMAIELQMMRISSVLTVVLPPPQSNVYMYRPAALFASPPAGLPGCAVIGGGTWNSNRVQDWLTHRAHPHFTPFQLPHPATSYMS